MLVFYYSEDGGARRKGPYTASQLEKLRRGGRIAPNARVWSEEIETQDTDDSEPNKISRTRGWGVVICGVLLGIMGGIYLSGGAQGGIQTPGKAIAAAPLPGLFPEDGPAEPEIPESVIRNMEILQDLRISACVFEDTPVYEALMFLNAEARKAGVSVNFMSETYGEPEPVIPYLEQEDVTAAELLKAICDTCNCSFTVETVGVFVCPKSLEHLAELVEYQPRNAAEQQVQDTLKEIIIPSVAFDGNSVDDAMMFLLAETRMAGFNVKYEYVGEQDVVIPSLGLEQISAYDLLRCICRRTGCVFWSENGTVLLAPADELEY